MASPSPVGTPRAQSRPNTTIGIPKSKLQKSPSGRDLRDVRPRPQVVSKLYGRSISMGPPPGSSSPVPSARMTPRQVNEDTLSDAGSDISVSKIRSIKHTAELKKGTVKSPRLTPPKPAERKKAVVTDKGQGDTEEAAIQLQRMWRGYRSRNLDPQVVKMRGEIRQGRTEQHIRSLEKELEETKRALEQERKMRLLQTEAISALWKQIQSMQASPQPSPVTDVSDKVNVRSTEEAVVELNKTCTTLQGQVEELHTSLQSVVNLMVNSLVGTPRIDAKDNLMVSAPRSDTTDNIMVGTPRSGATDNIMVSTPRSGTTDNLLVSTPRGGSTENQMANSLLCTPRDSTTDNLLSELDSSMGVLARCDHLPWDNCRDKPAADHQLIKTEWPQSSRCSDDGHSDTAGEPPETVILSGDQQLLPETNSCIGDQQQLPATNSCSVGLHQQQRASDRPRASSLSSESSGKPRVEKTVTWQLPTSNICDDSLSSCSEGSLTRLTGGSAPHKPAIRPSQLPVLESHKQKHIPEPLEKFAGSIVDGILQEVLLR